MLFRTLLTKAIGFIIIKCAQFRHFIEYRQFSVILSVSFSEQIQSLQFQRNVNITAEVEKATDLPICPYQTIVSF